MAATAEICIVGAGIAGLNALVVASEYLSPDDTAVLVDSRPRVGGMWVDTYDYVRLHQPHRIFTAGSVPWRPRRPAQHLASKPEVLDHLAHCRDVVASRVRLDERLGWDYVSHREDGGLVEVTLRGPDGTSEVLTTRRLIKAFGHHIMPSTPLALTSGRVRSVTPESLDLEGQIRSGTEPIWIIGGGKTGMDTAHLLVTAMPGREVNLVAGPGVFFARREEFFPTGLDRWWRGKPINTMLREVCERFDGTNEAEVRDWYHHTYAVSPVDDAQEFFSAYLSDDECAVIRAGLHAVEHDYLADAVDTADGTELVFRSGGRVSVPAGTWVVNCTGLMLRDEHPHEPAVSDSGHVVSIQMRSSVTGPFTAFAGYYLSHLMFLGKLHDAGLYELDVEDLAAKNRSALIYASFALALYNLGRISRVVPKRVMMDCGLDYDRWYPAPRRMLGAIRFLRAQRGIGRRNRRSLDAIAERYGVRCGPIVSPAPGTEEDARLDHGRVGDEPPAPLMPERPAPDPG